MQQPVGAHLSCVALFTSGSRPPLLMRHVNARYVVFRSFGEGSEGGLYYDTLHLTHAKHPQTLLAYEMSTPCRSHTGRRCGFASRPSSA